MDWISATAEVYATLLDEEHYLCSERTMYRILAASDEVRERRDQLRHPSYAAPELMATAPNELWSWDITKLKGAAKWAYYYLYVILDVFSRYVVGWMVAQRESATLAERLIEETCEQRGVTDGQLTLHADRGPSMRSKNVALLLADLGVTKTHSRPYTYDRQPVFGGAVPDDEVPAGVSGPVRMSSACAQLLRAVLRLVQQRTPARWTGDADAPGRPPRPRRPPAGQPGGGPCRGLRGASRAVSARGTHAGCPSAGRLDQQTGRMRVRGRKRTRRLRCERRSRVAER